MNTRKVIIRQVTCAPHYDDSEIKVMEMKSNGNEEYLRITSVDKHRPLGLGLRLRLRLRLGLGLGLESIFGSQ